MTDFKSNVPKDFRLDIYYQPVKTEYDKQVHAEITRKSWEDPEIRAKRAEGVAKAFEDPILKEEQRNRALSALEIINSDPELKAANGRRGAEIWNDPSIAEKHKEACKEAWKNPSNKRKSQLSKNHEKRKIFVEIDGVPYESVRAAAKVFGIHESTMKNRFDKKWPGYIKKE